MRRLNYQLRRGLDFMSCVNKVNYELVAAKWLSADCTCMGSERVWWMGNILEMNVYMIRWFPRRLQTL
jgi:hypothetical protein